VDAVERELAEIDAQMEQFNVDMAMSEVALENAKTTQQALLSAIAKQTDVVEQLRLGIIYMVNAQYQDAGLGAAIAFAASDSPEAFLHSLATQESIGRLLEERIVRFMSEQERLDDMKKDFDSQVGRIESELANQEALFAAQRLAAASVAEALARLTPEEREALEARIAASGGVLPFSPPSPARINSPFGPRPNLGGFHWGNDFSAGCWQPITASAMGTVLQAGYYGDWGLYVLIDHGRAGITGNYYKTGYAHMNRILVSPGQFVERGELIGLVGSTGFSTGCHVHWEVFQNGQRVDGSLFLVGAYNQSLGDGYQPPTTPPPPPADDVAAGSGDEEPVPPSPTSTPDAPASDETTQEE
jgi:murein DD-endopeptidase MepM/ murein hydrolase activator NlpD